MIPVISSKQMRVIDQRAETEYKIPSLVLMERAACGIWHKIASLPLLADGYHPPDTPVTVVAGRGNNGGDALAVARYAQSAGYNVTIILFAASTIDQQTLSPLCRQQHDICRSLHIPIQYWQDPSAGVQKETALEQAHVIIDGLCGNGIRGALREDMRELVGTCVTAPPPRY